MGLQSSRAIMSWPIPKYLKASVHGHQFSHNPVPFRSRKMPSLSISKLVTCLGNGCQDHSKLGTRIYNLTDSSIELQIRVGSIMKKIHTLKPGSSKRLKSKTIYKAYMPSGNGEGGQGGMRSLLYYYDEACQPYVLIHDTRGGFSRMVKQQYVSLEDLRDCSEIRVYRDHQRGCISVRKKPRATHFC